MWIRILLLFIFVWKQTEFLSNPLALVLHLLLHQVETHGDQRKSESKPEHTENEFLVGRPLFHIRPRHDVTESDSAEGYEAEIRSSQVVPTLPEGEQGRTSHDVSTDDDQTDADWDCHLLLGFQLVIFVEI